MTDTPAGLSDTAARGTASETPASFAGLLRDLVNDLGRLFRSEVRLARLEAEQKLHHVIGGLVLLGIGLVFAIVSLALAAEALVVFLSRSLEPWLANLVVAGGGAVLCLLFFAAARRSLSARNLKPTRTLRSLSKDADVIQEAIDDVSR